MPDSLQHVRFRSEVLPHVDAAYNLARWIVGQENDAQDVTQEALLRAFRSFHQHRGENARAWLLTIVRNCAYTHQRVRRRDCGSELDEQQDFGDCSGSSDPSVIVANRLDSSALREAIAALPIEFREVVVLRELEQMDYKQIAAVVDVPIGTVMSRLARGRARLRATMHVGEEVD